MHQGSPLIYILHCHATSTVIPLLQRPPSHHPSNLTSVYPVPSPTYFRHKHPSSHTELIHSLHVSKPSQYSLLHSTRQFPFYCCSSTYAPLLLMAPYKLFCCNNLFKLLYERILYLSFVLIRLKNCKVLNFVVWRRPNREDSRLLSTIKLSKLVINSRRQNTNMNTNIYRVCQLIPLTQIYTVCVNLFP